MSIPIPRPIPKHRNCVICHQPFKPKRQRQIYDKRECRIVAFYRRREEAIRREVIEELKRQKEA